MKHQVITVEEGVKKFVVLSAERYDEMVKMIKDLQDTNLALRIEAASDGDWVRFDDFKNG